MNPLQMLNPFGALVDLGAQLLGLPPELKDAVKVAAGAATGNFLMAADGALGLANSLARFPSPAPEYLPSKTTSTSGYAPPPEKDPLAKQRLEALRTLRKSFKDAEVAGALLKMPDGRLGLEDLHALVMDPKVGADLKRAAQFLLDHPQEYAAIAKTGTPFAVNVWYISQSDIDEAVEKAQEARDRTPRSPSTPRNPTTPRSPNPPRCTPSSPSSPSSPSGPKDPCGCGPGGGSTSGGSIQDIIKDPNLSMEAKLRAILWSVMENLDEEMLSLGAEMDDLAEERKSLTPEDQDKSADLQRNLDKMSDRFHMLVQRRQAMFELLSNITEKQGDMAMRAISNLGR